jgi:peptidoglycan/LPS O-acetylase OafA/YrhL
MSAVAAADREKHLDALTGIRALAAGWVVAFHLWLNGGHPALVLPGVGIDLTPWVAVGWLGVDVFFILSGFVLTWQVLHARDSPHAAAGASSSAARVYETGILRANFWRDAGRFIRRRALRVYPAYLACLSVLLPLAWWGLYRTPPELGDVALHLAMFHNIVPGYVDSINGVFWSMPFEWQFYLIFPLLVLPVMRARTGWLVVGAVTVAVCAKLSSALQGPGAEIAQLPWRIDEFVAGMAAAAIAVRCGWSPRMRIGMTWIAAAALVAGSWIVGARDATWWQPGAMPFVRAAWIDISVASLLIGLSGSASAIAALFASRAMVWLGTISYSIYLWHLPTLDLTRRVLRLHMPTLPAVLDLGVTIAVVLAVSALSYYAVERPFHAPSRDAGTRWRRPRFRLAIVVGWIFGIMLVAAGMTMTTVHEWLAA